MKNLRRKKYSKPQRNCKGYFYTSPKLSLDDLLDRAEYGKTVDPEFIGKVFESLLACIDADSEESRRKVTGSYYTPREIVDYMVNAALDACLARHSRGSGNLDDRLHSLGSRFHGNDGHCGSDLLQCKILDPACGSGAFPCEVLNIILHRIEEEKIEKENAGFSSSERYSTKLKIIRDVIYGADIQPMAVQITLLRFFLSLIQDIVPDKHKANYGIEPLPNLETKFVCANTLIGLEKKEKNGQGKLELPIVKETIKQLVETRGQHLTARTVQEKERLRKYDAALRKTLGIAMESAGDLTHDVAEKLMSWDPYNQFHSSPFFDSVCMFGVEKFDIVIGNPPYVRADNSGTVKQRTRIIESGQYETLYEKWDLFVPFIERGLKLLRDRGVLHFIVSNALTTSKYADRIQKWIIENHFVRQIDFFENIKIFNQAVVPVIISVIANQKGKATRKVYHRDKIKNTETVSVDNKGGELQKRIFRQTYSKRFGKQRVKTIKLGDICYISVGMVVNADEKKAKGQFSRDDLISDTKDKKHTRPYIEGKDLCAYFVKRVRYIESNTYRVRTHLRRPTFRELYQGEKIMRGRATLGTIDDTGLTCNDSVFVMKRFCDLHGVENKSIAGSISKNNKKKTRQQLEKVSEGYDLRFLLGIINSKYALAYLENYRRSAIPKMYYPDDFRNLPIPIVSLAEQKPLIALVKKRLAATPKTSVKLDEQIDALVYALYGLTAEEIAVVEG